MIRGTTLTDFLLKVYTDINSELKNYPSGFWGFGVLGFWGFWIAPKFLLADLTTTEEFQMLVNYFKGPFSVNNSGCMV